MVPTHDSSKKFICQTCDYSTCRKSQYDRHLQTDKHMLLQNHTEKTILTKKIYVCDCGKSYKHSSTLYAHKKQCLQNKKVDNVINKDDLVIELLKQNAELIKENSLFKNIILNAIEANNIYSKPT